MASEYSFYCVTCNTYKQLKFGAREAHRVDSIGRYICPNCLKPLGPSVGVIEEMINKPVDPKQSQAVKKMSFTAVPISLMLRAQPGNQNGADKYGVYNWLKLDDGSMSMSTYLNALQRHLILFKAGQDNTSDTNINNLDSMISGLAVLRDAMLFNKVNDDRVKLSPEQIVILEKLINNEVD